MILKKFKHTLKKYHLLEKGEGVLIAYSGGTDSTALLSLFLEIKEEWALRLYLGHFNHRLRSTAEQDVEFVKKMAQYFSLPLVLEAEDVRSYAREKGLNLEEAGRKLRYEFLNKAALQVGAQRIATGHTQNDQAETVLMRIIRGSGLKGLTGISPLMGEKIIRPLLFIQKKEIEEYIREKGLAFSEDESNKDTRFLRNKIRWKLIPFLEKELNPQIVSNLSTLASLLQEDEEYLQKKAEHKMEKAVIKEKDHLYLDVSYVSQLSAALARRVVRGFILQLRGSLRGISYEDVEKILSLNKGKKYSLKNMLLGRENNYIFLKEKLSSPVRYGYWWNGKEILHIKEAHLKFKLHSPKKEGFYPEFNDSSRAYLDKYKLSFPLFVRNRLPGDRYQPLGAPGRKKLKEIMRAKRILLYQREKLPVFLSRGEIVWVLGLPVSDKYKVTAQTEEVGIIQKIGD